MAEPDHKATPTSIADGDDGYRVLARSYRPQTFEDLIGQDAMVRTLSNAFATGRVAHGFILTGVRGVGKTTTARIIAKGLNCIGPDGKGGPTVSPCGVCEPCRSIAESRAIDVLEMDAASRTGIDDIREIIESVRYRPAQCRYKVYIIDEVHMLSKAAFNGLLKTLEEPPPHVKFIFATTEIRKVPVTVLSRCQRFDLRRIEPEPMMAYLAGVADKEGAKLDDGALALLARASEGSMRDAVSLLDQAIAHGQPGEDGVNHLTQDQVRDMLGLADRARVIDLFDLVMKGDIEGALTELRAQYDTGADPLMILTDLLEVTHWLTRLTVVPSAAADPAIPSAERERGAQMAKDLPVNVLTRAWQLLLKGLSEAQGAPNPLAAAEMIIIRLGYAASLKPPDDLLRLLDGGGASQSPAPARPAAPSASAPSSTSAAAPRGHGTAPAAAPASAPRAVEQGSAARALAPQTDTVPDPAPAPVSDPQTEDHPQALPSFDSLVALAHDLKEVRLETELRRCVHLVRFEPGRIEFRPTPDAPKDLSERLQAHLKTWTGRRWVVSVVSAGGAPTLHEVDEAAASERRAEVMAHPLVKAALEAFPGAELGDVRSLQSDPDLEQEAAGPTDGFEEDDDF